MVQWLVYNIKKTQKFEAFYTNTLLQKIWVPTKFKLCDRKKTVKTILSKSVFKVNIYQSKIIDTTNI